MNRPVSRPDPATILLRHVRLSKRARAACEALGLQTLGAALACDDAKFLAVPGCGRSTLRGLREHLRSAASCAPGEWHDLPVAVLDAPLRRIGRRDATTRALQRAGIENLGQLLTAPPAEIDAMRGVDPRAWRKIAEYRGRLDRTRALAGASLLPNAILSIPIARLYLPDVVLRALGERGVDTLGGLLTRDSAELGLDDAGAAVVREELTRLLRLGLDRFTDDLRDEGKSFRACLQRLLDVAVAGDRELCHRRIGLDRSAETALQIGAKSGTSQHEVEARERALVQRIHAHFSILLGRLRREIRKELATMHGMLTTQNLAPGTLLRSARDAGGDDPALALRFAEFVFPGEFHAHESMLSEMPTERFQLATEELRRACRRSVLPRAVDDVQQDLARRGFEVSREWITHVARRRLERAVDIDPLLGEMLTERTTTIADRLQQLIEERGTSVDLDQLMFDYRERFRSCQRNSLRDHLVLDGRFLEIGCNLWSLRDRHLDELELARVEAQRISAVIRTVGGRHAIATLAEAEPYAERQIHVIADILRHDPLLRDLGRHEFCPRYQQHSQVMLGLLDDLRRAMGEIPMSRFLENQPPQRVRLIRRLLQHNRAFVSPAADRIDLLTNYPFDQDRIRRLAIVAEQCLEQQGGYASLAHVQSALCEAGLGGDYLTEHLLEDLLRRHCRFEILPGGILAQVSLNLSGWIQQKAREAIRSCGRPLSIDEVLLERPQLAEFSPCLRQLLELDPLLLSSADGTAFQVA